jgi:hypothetical protein
MANDNHKETEWVPTIEEAERILIEAVRTQSHVHAVSYELFINSSEHEVKVRSKNPESLRNDGISMKNLYGTYIK